MKSSKKVVFGPQFVGGWDTPDVGHAFLNCTHFRACGRFSLSSVQRGRRRKIEEEEKEEEESAVKHKSADMYVGRGLIIYNSYASIYRTHCSPHFVGVSKNCTMLGLLHVQTFVQYRLYNLHFHLIMTLSVQSLYNTTQLHTRMPRDIVFGLVYTCLCCSYPNF